MPMHGIREIRPVDAAVVAARQQRDATRPEAVQRRERGVRRGADRIVDVRDAIANAQRLQPMRQRLERGCVRRQGFGIEPQRLDSRQHSAQVAAIVAPGQRHVAGVEHRMPTAMHDIAAQMPAVGSAEEAHLALRQCHRRQRAVLAVEDRDARLGSGEQCKFVVDITRFAAVPVEVLGEDVGRDRDLRRHPGCGNVAGLVAGQFDHPEFWRLHIARLTDILQFQHRQADVPAQRGAVAARAQQVREQRRGGALALGAGDADRARVGVFGEPQRGAADETRAAFGRRQRFRPVGTDARRFDHHLERRQALGAGIGVGGQQCVAQRVRLGDFSGRTEQGQRQCRQTTTQRAIRRAALAAPTPQRDPLVAESRDVERRIVSLRIAHAGAPRRPPARDVRRRGSAAARSAVPGATAADGSRGRNVRRPHPRAIRGAR